MGRVHSSLSLTALFVGKEYYDFTLKHHFFVSRRQFVRSVWGCLRDVCSLRCREAHSRAVQAALKCKSIEQAGYNILTYCSPLNQIPPILHIHFVSITFHHLMSFIVTQMQNPTTTVRKQRPSDAATRVQFTKRNGKLHTSQ